MNNAEVLIKFKADTKEAEKQTDEMSASLGKLTKAFTLGNLASKAITKGIQVFSANLDTAISRVDTLNNFPRVMSNLGISAEESEKAIAKINDKLQGLPTTIDSAAMAVQRFTSKNGDVQKSADLFLAVNNAILAGGANPQIQANALEQLSQAYAKGKPDMMEWRTLQTAMPAQLKQVAKAMGYENAALLGEAVRAKDGAKEFSRMMDTMMKMNTQGVAGFKSFDEQARNATGGIQTSMTNMKTAFVRGIADMIKQVDKSLEPFGGLKGVLSSVGKLGEQAFKTIGKALGTIIPKLIQFGKWIVKNKNWIIPLVGAIGSFVVAFKAIKTVIGIVKGMTTAIKLMNATIMANPAVAIIAGITAIIVGLTLLYNNCEGFRNFVNGWLNGFKIMVNGIVSFFKGAIDKVIGFVNGVINFFKTNWQGILLFIVNPFAGAFKLLYDNCEGFRNMVNNVINAVKGFFTGLWNGMKSGAQNAWNGIKSVFSTVASFFKNIFTNAWTAVKNVFSTGGKIFTGIKDGIVNAFTNIVNAIIKGINKVIKVPFDAINGVLKKIKNIDIAGAKPFKGLIHTISVPKIPTLNVGTNFVPDDTLAMIHKGEAVIPKKFNPYANPSNSMLGALNNSRGKQVINVYASFKQDNLGQMVRDIKTFSGGARNDFNYGTGV